MFTIRIHLIEKVVPVMVWIDCLGSVQTELLGNNVSVSDAKKFVEYPFLAMLANAIAKSSMSTEP